MTETLFRTTERWGSRDSLGSIYRSPELIQRIVELERSAVLEDRTSVERDRVNASEHVNDSISKWVRYREGYSPELVRSILERFPKSNDSVLLDPMCGAGSTLLAGRRLGVTSVGLDVSPYAVLASNVKTRLIPAAALREVRAWLKRSTGVEPARWSRAQDEHLSRYFSEGNFRTLLAIREEIDRCWESGPSCDLLHLALLAVLEDCSNRRKDGNGLATRPSRVGDPWARFRLQVEVMVDSLGELLRACPDDVASAHLESAVGFDRAAVATDLSLAGAVGAIVFSPPYPNSFDYFESYKLELLFTGLVPFEEFGQRRRAQVRSFRQTGTSEPLADMPLVEGLVDEVVAAIPSKEKRTGARDGRTRLVPNLLRGYFADMKRVLEACESVMEAGAHVHIVVDQSAYAGIPVPTDLVLVDAGMQVGLRPEQLTLCRRAKTSGQQVRIQPALPKLLRESIVTLRKSS